MQEPTRAIRQDELLSHMGWVQRLARGLVRDASTAEDVAQDALLVALERPPRTARSGRGLRAWLGKVTARLALQSARGEGRRRRRERAASEGGAHASSTHEVLERAATHRRVVELVMELDEPYRSTLLFRYLDDLRPSAIALETGVDAATVRKRISRGLARLRERLDRDSGGDRRAWMSALAALGHPGGTATGASPLGAGLALGAGLVAATGVVLAAYVLVPTAPTTSLAVDPSGAQERPESSAAVAATVPAPAPANASGRRAVGPAPSASSAAQSGGSGARPLARATGAGEPSEPADPGRLVLERVFSLRGRVEDESGRPVAGAHVCAFRPGGPSSRDGRAIDHRFDWPYPYLGQARTDGEGRFELEPLPEGLLHVWASDLRHVAALSELLRLGEEEQPPAELSLVLGDLPEENRISGIVVDAAGAPVEGASIEIDEEGGEVQFEEWLTTDDEGRFVTGTHAGSRFSLRARDPRERYGPVTLDGLAPGQGELTIVLGEARSRALVVLDGNGNAVPEYGVSIHPSGEAFASHYRRVEDGAGRTLLPLPDRPYVLAVEARDFFVSELGPLQPSAAEELVVVLRPLARLTGRVTADGEGVPGARVLLYATECSEMRLGHREVMRCTTAADGAFDVPIQFACTFSLICEAEGWAVFERGPLRLDPARPETVDVVLGHGGVVEGFVRAPAGRDVEGSTVRLLRNAMVDRAVTAAADGWYRLDAVPPGPWKVEVAGESPDSSSGVTLAALLPAEGAGGDGDRAPHLVVREGETTRCDLELAARASLEGTVTVDGRPEGAFVLAVHAIEHPWTFGGGGEASLDREGTFAVDGLSPGGHRLVLTSAESPLGVVRIVRRLELAPGVNRVDVEVATSSASGTASPHDDWSLVVHMDASTYAVLPVVPDGTGAFELPLVPSGTARLVRRGSEGELRDPTTWEEVRRRRLAPGAHVRFETVAD